MHPAIPELRIDKNALAQNWRALNQKSDGKAAAVVKADGYGLGLSIVAKALWNAGNRQFFVATYDEATELLDLLPEAIVYELSGTSIFAPARPNLISVLNSQEMVKAIDTRPFAIQFDTGMSRLGFDLDDLDALRLLTPKLVMSHLACADEPGHEMNKIQLKRFQSIAEAFPNAAKSLSATGGILLGRDYQFDLTRPGIGIYGGAPFLDAKPTIQIALPMLQIREIPAGASIGYGADFVAPRDMKIATVFGGYADGLSRQFSPGAALFHNDTACPILGRVSMDAVVVDIGNLPNIPTHLHLFHASQTINDLAKLANTIPYELFTSLGSRYKRFEV